MDECAQPYTTQQTSRARKEFSAPKKPVSTAANRFQLLNIDDDDDKDEDIKAVNFRSSKKSPVGIAA